MSDINMGDIERISTEIQPEMAAVIAEYAADNPDASEPILTEERLSIYPPAYPKVYEELKLQKSLFWDDGEIDTSNDRADFEKLDQATRDYVEQILAFFLVADQQVNKNLAMNFIPKVKANEVEAVYDWQKVMERIHEIVYSRLFHEIVVDPTRREQLKDACKSSPFVRLKSNWANKWIYAKNVPFAVKVLAFVCVEVIFFQDQFASVQWVVRKSKGLQGLSKSNDFISRDEGRHGKTGIMVLLLLEKQLPVKLVEMVAREAVAISQACARFALPTDLVGLNARMLGQFTECVADKVYSDITGLGALWGTPNPFPLYKMVSSGAEKKNFFERQSTEYQVDAKPLPQGIVIPTDIAAFRNQQRQKRTQSRTGAASVAAE